MKKLILLLSITLCFGESLEWTNLNRQQRINAIEIYKIAKPYNLAETMISIAWQESRLGLIPINISDPSCGIHHINLKTFLRLKGKKDNPANRNYYCNRLIQDINLSTNTAIEVFNNFKDYHRGNYSKAIKSYNAGYNIKNRQAIEYAHSVQKNALKSKKIVERIESILKLESMLKLLVRGIK